MKEKEKIKQIYQKLEVGIREEDIDRVLEDKEKVKKFMDLYEREKNRKYKLYFRKTIRQ